MWKKYFWAKVKKTKTCWLWTGGLTRDGYGRMKIKGKRKGVHRISWEIANRKTVPKGLVIMHICDVTSCVNPDHLKAGTPLDNSWDCANKGRQVTTRGIDHPMSKLDAPQIKKIRRDIDSKLYSQQEIADKFNVSQTLISQVKRRKIWTHI